MIRSFEIVDPDKTHIGWLAKVPALAKPRKFAFGPGLNVLFGRNGSGKSTVLKAMARLLHCEQGGTPLVSQHSVGVMFERQKLSAEVPDYTKAMRLDHDGQGVRFFDPGVKVGASQGFFDDDFFEEGLLNTMFRGSSGETTMARFDKFAAALVANEAPKVERARHMRLDHANPFYAPRLALVEAFLKGTGEPGPMTVLLDEPERSYDLGRQVAVWRFLRAMAGRAQLIVASHALFALELPEAHYIEMEEGALEEATRALALLVGGWKAEKPATPEAVEAHAARRASERQAAAALKPEKKKE